MKRRPDQEREETTAREQAETRRDALLAELKAREAAGRAPEPPAAPPDPAPGPAPGPAPEPAPDEEEAPDEEAPPPAPE